MGDGVHAASLRPSLILYKKTKAGQTKYKHSIPRFVAISDQGICIKWNADVPLSDFYNEAYSRLKEDMECGSVWVVCVLFRPTTALFQREKVYFRIEFSISELATYQKEAGVRKEFIHRVSMLRVKITSSLDKGIVRTSDDLVKLIAEFPDQFNNDKEIICARQKNTI